jgi:hypothetical protein
LGHYHDVSRSTADTTKELRELIPCSDAAFRDLHKSAFATHARDAERLGETTEEYADMSSVTIPMNGGPGTIYAPKALEALEDFRERRA